MSTVLVINSGSSSIKYKLLEPESGDALASGIVERIGEDSGRVAHTTGDGTTELTDPVPDHAEGLRRVLELFERAGPSLAEAGVVAVGHRVVQGGQRYDGPVVIDRAVEAEIDRLSPVAPLHNPPNLTGIRVARELLRDVPHVAVFDTAFFHDLPAAAATYALDREVAATYRVRRYGAHGTSHQYVSGRVSDLLGREDLRQVVLHLGNGASASAVVAGRAVETSMGLTPLEGLVMGTRTGDIDPAVTFHLARNAGMSVDEIDELYNKRSGLKGLTGQNDLREVWRLADDGDPQAALALEIYAHRIRKYVGAYAAAMGGIDALTFTAGVGENDARMRALAADGLAFLGIRVDPGRNASRGRGERVISPDGGGVTVLVVPTNEELEIARQTVSLL
ncbi:acetate/propionate family kinase [Georgenia alba]|uniref:Acetate kinase n=1 Tax=Georgenia alba TaxID=2233858 RepID=A0ABW2QCJ7_9MICO